MKNPVINLIVGIFLIVCLYLVVINSTMNAFGKKGLFIGGALATYYVYKLLKDQKEDQKKKENNNKN